MKFDPLTSFMVNIKHLCTICKKHVRKNTKAIQCDLCDQWTCISCASVSKERYEVLILPENNDPFLCNSCINNALPFSNETDKSFCQTNLLGLNEDNNIENLSFKLSRAEKKSINQISNLILETNDPNHQSKVSVTTIRLMTLLRKISIKMSTFQYFT